MHQATENKRYPNFETASFSMLSSQLAYNGQHSRSTGNRITVRPATEAAQ